MSPGSAAPGRPEAEPQPTRELTTERSGHPPEHRVADSVCHRRRTPQRGEGDVRSEYDDQRRDPDAIE